MQAKVAVGIEAYHFPLSVELGIEHGDSVVEGPGHRETIQALIDLLVQHVVHPAAEVGALGKNIRT